MSPRTMSPKAPVASRTDRRAQGQTRTNVCQGIAAAIPLHGRTAMELTAKLGLTRRPAVAPKERRLTRLWCGRYRTTTGWLYCFGVWCSTR
jgi:hypothetical protein